MHANPITPVYLLTGFLGSGKTTLLNDALDYCTEAGLKPAVIMNEIGDINIDGQLVGPEVPMAELLNGCICCTISGDLGMTLYSLYRDERPDVIFIESTGVANPLDVIDSITEGSLLVQVELKRIVTVIDASFFLNVRARGKGKSQRLMEEQIRSAGWLIVNKSDLVTAEQLREAEHALRELNPHAPIRATVHCKGGLDFMTMPHPTVGMDIRSTGRVCESVDCNHDHHHDQHHHLQSEGHSHSYDHVMVYTHFFTGPIDRTRFEQMIRTLPEQVYRAKGIVRFIGDDRPHMFQYAYRELNVFPITPRSEVPDAAVFIGEQFSGAEASELIARFCG